MFGNVTFEVMLARVLVLFVMLFVAFPIHEFAHAFAAYRLGDSTARLFGRLTLNPLAHFDPMGGLILSVSILLLGFGFGWAKPTPVNPRNLSGGRWGEAIVSAAGPISNLVLAIAGAIPLRFIFASGLDASLAIPTLCMGATLPLLTRQVVENDRQTGHRRRNRRHRHRLRRRRDR